MIADLPEKVEMSAFCSLSREQAALYEQAVRDLEEKLEEAEGIKRRGLVLAQLMRLKQICNHRGQLAGTGDYAPEKSGKFQRLARLCEELASARRKCWFSRSFARSPARSPSFSRACSGAPASCFTAAPRSPSGNGSSRAFSAKMDRPFFVLSLKAGGTGLEPDRRLSGDSLRPLVEPRRRKPGD